MKKSTDHLLLFSLLSAALIFVYLFFLYSGFFYPIEKITAIISTFAFLTFSIVLININKKALMVICFIILFVFPFPFSLLVSFFSFYILLKFSSNNILEILFHITMLLISGTYLIPYIISINKTVRLKKISFFSFLPIVHNILLLVIFFFWFWFIMKYK